MKIAIWCALKYWHCGPQSHYSYHSFFLKHTLLQVCKNSSISIKAVPPIPIEWLYWKRIEWSNWIMKQNEWIAPHLLVRKRFTWDTIFTYVTTQFYYQVFWHGNTSISHTECDSTAQDLFTSVRKLRYGNMNANLWKKIVPWGDGIKRARCLPLCCFFIA